MLQSPGRTQQWGVRLAKRVPLARRGDDDAADLRRPFLGPGGTGVAARAQTGALTHEVMVLPLNPNHYPGQRAIGANNQVDETGNLAEASRSCGADAGDASLPVPPPGPP